MTREEAINTVRNIYQTDKEKEALEILIPELSNSEDERIRKWLIDYFEKVNDEVVKEDRLKIITYLKKQKEQKIDEYPLCETIKDKIKCYISNHFIADREVTTDIPSIVHAMEEGVKLGKDEQKKQKPKFKVGDMIRTLEKNDEGTGPMYEDEIVSVGDDGSYKLKHLGELYLPESEWELVKKYRTEEKKEQKPTEWSKEDNDIIEGMIIDYEGEIEHLSDSIIDEQAKPIYQGRIDFLKRLKTGCPQPNTVSIKDATKFGNLEYERGVKDGIQHSENHRWKPSEEQMDALKHYVDTTTDGEIELLYNDLLKIYKYE